MKVVVRQPVKAEVTDMDTTRIRDRWLVPGTCYEVDHIEGPDRSVGIFGGYVSLIDPMLPESVSLVIDCRDPRELFDDIEYDFWDGSDDSEPTVRHWPGVLAWL